ncbi:MAG: lysophospholipid acyltransferase family protein [Erysipelotrichaceae bacterium]|nr:lysophospholipid acyltransferase family protein [Erysipelotrichaceae bacterium]
MGNSCSNLYQKNEDQLNTELLRQYDGQSYLRLRKTLIPLFTLLYHPKIINREAIPVEGPILIAGNHRSILDPLFVCAATERIVHFMAKRELHEDFYGKFFDLAETIPVNRDQKDPHSIDIAYGLLNSGRAIGIMPEGRVNKTNEELLPLKFGTVALAKKTQALIIPFGLTGSFKPFHYDMCIRFGQPLDIAELELSEANRLLSCKIKELIHTQE